MYLSISFFYYHYYLCIFQVLHHNLGSYFVCELTMVYTTISHSKLRDRLKELAQLGFKKKNDLHRYTYQVIERDKYYLVKNYSDSTKILSKTDIFQMFEFLIDNIFLMFGGHVSHR